MAENSFNAVERIDEIAHIPQEDREDIPGSRPDSWPSSGKVGLLHFCNLRAGLVCLWTSSHICWLQIAPSAAMHLPDLRVGCRPS